MKKILCSISLMLCFSITGCQMVEKRNIETTGNQCEIEVVVKKGNKILGNKKDFCESGTHLYIKSDDVSNEGDLIAVDLKVNSGIQRSDGKYGFGLVADTTYLEESKSFVSKDNENVLYVPKFSDHNYVQFFTLEKGKEFKTEAKDLIFEVKRTN